MASMQLVEICVILFLGSLLQGAVGFGMGMFSISVMIWFHIPITSAVAIVIVASGLQTLWSWYNNREHLDWREPVRISVIRMMTVPLGIMTLGVLSVQSQAVIKQVVGGVIVIVLLAQWGLRIKPREKVAEEWMWVAGLSSGFLTGLIDMGGPPLVLWVMAHDWPNRKARAFLWFSSFLVGPVMIALLLWRFGAGLIFPMLLGVVMTPVIIGGTWWGLRVGQLMNRSRLRVAMMVLLLVIAVASLVR